jgi:hypothetical protein
LGVTSLHVLCDAIIPAHAIVGFHRQRDSVIVYHHPLLVLIVYKFWILVFIWIVIPLYIVIFLFLLTPDGRRVPMNG